MPLILCLCIFQEDSAKSKTTPTYREMRFLQFASVEYKGVIYMTPQDFLESVTEEMPRRRSCAYLSGYNCITKDKMHDMAW